MKQSQYVVHNRGLSQILFSTPWSVRSIFKHVFVIAYIALITFIAFDFNTFKDAMEVAAGKNDFDEVILALKFHAPQVAWDILLIFLEVRLLRRTLKMLQTSNKNMLVFIPFSLMALGAAIFIAVFLPGWMKDKMILEPEYIERFKLLSVFMYFYLMVPGITILWSLANATNERRVSPFVARANIFTSLNMILWIGAIGCGAVLAHMLFLGNNIVPFNYHSPIQLFLMIAGGLLFIITIITSIWSQHDMRVKTNYKFFNKNIEQAISVAMIFPLAIWLCASFIHMNGNWMEYLFIAIVVISSISCVVYALIRKTEAGSPRVFMVITSLLLTIIWMSKFFFEYLWGYSVSTMFTLPVAMIGTAIIVGTIYWKSPMTSKMIMFLSARFIKALWIVVFASWIVSIIPDTSGFASILSSVGGSVSKLAQAIADIIPQLSESLNLVLMALPISSLALTLTNWYVTQWKIKSHMTYKNKKESKKKNLKEAGHA